jgi:predicted nucleotidyltransferase
MNYLEELDKVIKEIIKEIKKNEVDAIYLFGSYATGRAKPISDIDICVITKRDTSKDIKEQILSNSSKKIDIVVFWDLPPAIRFRVLKKGKLLYERDYLTLHRIKIDTLKSYLDIQPMTRRHCSKVLGE